MTDAPPQPVHLFRRDVRTPGIWKYFFADVLFASTLAMVGLELIGWVVGWNQGRHLAEPAFLLALAIGNLAQLRASEAKPHREPEL